MADAAEVKLGGYYKFRMYDSDSTNATDEASGVDNQKFWTHRLQINMDMIASEKSHAHLRFRPVSGGNRVSAGGALPSGTGLRADYSNGGTWSVNQLWLETEAWGIGVKAGEMPISLNDNLLVNHDGDSFSSVILSKSFGDVTALGAWVKVAEDHDANDPASAATNNDGASRDNEDDVDLWVLSVLGKVNNVNYQATAAHMRVGENNAAPFVAGDDDDNTWLALTLGTDVGGVNATGTVIYENGWDIEGGNDDGWLVGVRLDGKAGFGGWNAYGYYASEDFQSIISDEADWSLTWDDGGPTSNGDLFKNLVDMGGNPADQLSNVWGLGAGLKIKAGAWTIEPSLDYFDLVEDAGAVVDSAWGGSLKLSTKIQEGTTLSLVGQYVDPDEANNSGMDDSMHNVYAELNFVF
jgi:hypothetical protein